MRELADLDRLGEWAATPADQRSFLLLDLRVSSTVIAPWQEEVFRVTG